jgi:hypothetical protein
VSQDWPRFAEQADKQGRRATRFLSDLVENELAECDCSPSGLNRWRLRWRTALRTISPNRIFETCDAIIDHFCDAWNKLINQPGHIMSVGRRQWFQEF